LSACPGGDCSNEHSSDEAACYPLLVEIYRPKEIMLKRRPTSKKNQYNQKHGV